MSERSVTRPGLQIKMGMHTFKRPTLALLPHSLLRACMHACMRHRTPAQVVSIVKATASKASACELHAIPAVTYQMLTMATPSTVAAACGPGSSSSATAAAAAATSGSAVSPKLQILRSVVSLMDSLGALPRHQGPDGLPCPVLRSVSGVVLLHVANAARYDKVRRSTSWGAGLLHRSFETLRLNLCSLILLPGACEPVAGAR